MKKVCEYLNMVVDEVRWSTIIAHVTHFTNSMPIISWAVALGGLRAGGGVKHEAVQHCGGVLWSVQARILPMVAKTPNFFLSCARCARAVHIRPLGGYHMEATIKKMNDSRNTNFCVGPFEVLFRKICANAPRNGKIMLFCYLFFAAKFLLFLVD